MPSHVPHAAQAAARLPVLPAGGVARKYNAPFELDSCKAKFFEARLVRLDMLHAAAPAHLPPATLHNRLRTATLLRTGRRAQLTTPPSALLVRPAWRQIQHPSERRAPLPQIYMNKYAKPGMAIGHEGARQLVEECRAAGLRTAVASSADLVKVRASWRHPRARPGCPAAFEKQHCPARATRCLHASAAASNAGTRRGAEPPAGVQQRRTAARPPCWHRHAPLRGTGTPASPGHPRGCCATVCVWAWKRAARPAHPCAARPAPAAPCAGALCLSP